MDEFRILIDQHFQYPELLWLLCLPFPVLLLGLRQQRSFLCAALRALSLACLVLALAWPFSEQKETQSSHVALLDVSQSMSESALRSAVRELDLLTKDGAGTVRVYPFAAKLSAEAISIDSETEHDDAFQRIAAARSELTATETDLATAIRSANQRKLADSFLLLSDGFETLGDAGLEARSSAAIFPLLLDESLLAQKEVEISSLYAPTVIGSGERAEIRVSLSNPGEESVRRTVKVELAGKLLAQKELSVPPRSERLWKLQTEELEGGLQKLEASLENEAAAVSKRRWISVKEKTKLLLIHGSENEQRVLGKLLRLSGYGIQEVVASRETVPTDFSKFSSVLLNNVARKQLPADFLSDLESFVSRGGGALLIGGDRSFGLGGYIDTPLEKISPVKFLPPRSKKRRLKVAVALIIDKSGSMKHQGKIVAAREAALSAIRSLKDDDFVTVVGFDGAPFVVLVPMTVAEAKQIAERKLEGLTPNGQTNLLPAIQEARIRFSEIPAGRKHFIVLSDGQFSKTVTEFLREMEQLKAEGITVSTIALGSESDVPFLRTLARQGSGKFYRTLSADTLPELFLKDIEISTGEATMAEDDLFEVRRGPGETKAIALKRFPPLKGFIETLPKRKASLELFTRKGGKVFPILSNWKYGDGRVAAFTSDANGRWSLPWLKWSGFPKFWKQMLEFIKSSADDSNAEVDFDIRYQIDGRKLLLELSIFDEKLAGRPAPSIEVAASRKGSDPQTTLFRQVAEGPLQRCV